MLTATLRPILTLAAKDILVEARTKDVLLSVAMFGVVVLVVFNLALNITPSLASRLGPGVLWVSFSFSGVLAMNRAFVAEKERGSLEGLLLCPVSGDILFFGKMLGMLVFMLVVQGVLLPIYGVMFDFVGFTPALGLSVFLVTVGFATVGTLFAAIAVQTRSREIMLPTLFFPIVAPALIAAVETTTSAVNGIGILSSGGWYPLMAIFDAVFLLVCPWVFRAVLEE